MAKRIKVRESMMGYAIALPPAETEPPPETWRLAFAQSVTAAFPYVYLDKARAADTVKRRYKGTGRVVYVRVTIETE